MRRLIAHGTLIVLSLASVVFPARAQMRVRVEAGTKLPVRLDRGISTKDAKDWHSFGDVRTVTGTLMEDIVATNGRIALPAGTRIEVAILEDKRAGHVMGRSKLRLGLYSLSTPYGDVVPIDGYPTSVDHRKVDSEGTEHGHRSLIKDGAVDFTALTVGAGAGFLVAGPVGGAIGLGGGLIVAVAWTAIRRGPDVRVPPGTIVDFVLGRPVSFVPTREFIEAESQVQPATWGRGELVPPSNDLLDMADRLSTDPNGVLEQLKTIHFKDRSSVDRTFGKYLEAMARYQHGDRGKDTLHLMREAYQDSLSAPLAPAARAEMARNLVVLIRNTESYWERDPLLNDPQVQAALVEDMR